MADALLAITREYIKCFLALMGKGIYWPDLVLQSMRQQGLDCLDVTHVMSHGEAIDTEKDTADGTTYTMIGTTCDDIEIRVAFWADINQLDLRILDVKRN